MSTACPKQDSFPGCLLMLVAMLTIAGLAIELLSAPPASASLPRARRGCSTNSVPGREAGAGSKNFSHVFGRKVVGLTICSAAASHRPDRGSGVFELRTELRQPVRGK
jgi:hypothetical protein